jgi:hypothetical protein
VTVTLGGRNGLPSDRSGGAQSYSFKFDAVLHSVPQTAVYEVRRLMLGRLPSHACTRAKGSAG